MTVKHASDASFDLDVLKSERPVLVDFWAEWCGPCKQIAPALEDLAGERADKLDVVKINIDDNQRTPTRYGVRGIPTLMLFKGGQVAATKVGAMAKSKLYEWVELGGLTAAVAKSGAAAAAAAMDKSDAAAVAAAMDKSDAAAVAAAMDKSDAAAVAAAMDKSDAAAVAAAFRAAHPDIETFDPLIVDMVGAVRGKRLAIDALDTVLGGGMVLPGSTYVMDILGNNVAETGLGPRDGDPDYPLHPVGGTLVPIPWARRARAQVLMSMNRPDGSPYPYDPRAILAAVAARFAPLGLKPTVAVELEFYLLDPERTAEGGVRVAAPGGTAPTETQVYSLDDLDAIAPFLDEVQRACAIQGIPADVAMAEYAPGQYEINLRHVDDPVAAADHAILLKRAIRGTAERHGWVATFMAKPFIELPGNGTHIHLSLWDGRGRNVFDDGSEAGSDRLRHAIGGLRHTMAESMALFAPNANSFRRLRPGAWVPLAPTWGYNNRTVAVRIPATRGKSTRLEHRVAGADANPYLVLAAVLAGVHHGLEARLDPGPAIAGNAYDQVPSSMPASWAAALDQHDRAAILPRYIDADYLRFYAMVKRHERATFESRVTPTEYDWYMKTV